jgi:hypothetical protein
MPLTGKGFSPILGQLSLPARKTTGADAQLAFDPGGTLIAYFQQPECLTFEFRCVRLSRVFHPSPSESAIVHDVFGLSSCPLFRGKASLRYYNKDSSSFRHAGDDYLSIVTKVALLCLGCSGVC